MALIDIIDLGTAWRRVEQDVAKRVFVRYPYEIAVVRSDLEGWKGYVAGEIAHGRYQPGPMTIAEVPKGKGLIRPGSNLSLIDVLVYAACVGACFPAIHAALEWSQGTVDFGYMLAAAAAGPTWFRPGFTGWDAFRRESLRRLRQDGFTHIVRADRAPLISRSKSPRCSLREPA